MIELTAMSAAEVIERLPEIAEDIAARSPLADKATARALGELLARSTAKLKQLDEGQKDLSGKQLAAFAALARLIAQLHRQLKLDHVNKHVGWGLATQPGPTTKREPPIPARLKILAGGDTAKVRKMLAEGLSEDLIAARLTSA